MSAEIWWYLTFNVLLVAISVVISRKTKQLIMVAQPFGETSNFQKLKVSTVVYLPYLSLIIYNTFFYAQIPFGGVLAAIPIYLPTLFVKRVVNVDDVKKNAREANFRAVSGSPREALTFFKNLWSVSRAPYIAGTIGAMFYSQNNYLEARKWFELFHEGTQELPEETDEIFGTLKSEQELLLLSLYAENLFRLGETWEAEQLWLPLRKELRQSLAILHSGTSDVKKIIEGDEETITKVLISSRPINESHVKVVEENLGNAFLWREAVASSPTAENLLEEDDEGEMADVDEDYGNLNEMLDEDDVNTLFVSNYVMMTVSLLEKFYANTLLGLGYINLKRGNVEEAKMYWGEGWKYVGFHTFEDALELLKTYPNEAFLPAGSFEKFKTTHSWLGAFSTDDAMLYMRIMEGGSDGNGT